jgi:hypothetical protein
MKTTLSGIVGLTLVLAALIILAVTGYGSDSSSGGSSAPDDHALVLGAIGDKSTAEGVEMSFVISATDEYHPNSSAKVSINAGFYANISITNHDKKNENTNAGNNKKTPGLENVIPIKW